MPASVILLSGGLDSTVNTALAAADGGVRLALTCDYGQRAAEREIRSASAICVHYRIEHRVVEMRWLGEIAASPLTRREMPMVSPETAGFAQADAQAWIPNRNGIMLNIAAAYAESLGAGRVVTGFNAEEAANFPDNSAEFIVAANAAFRFSCRGRLEAFSYTVKLDKAAIIALARRHDVPLELSWWCYEGGPSACWRCASCLRFRRAAEAGQCREWLTARGISLGRG